MGHWSHTALWVHEMMRCIYSTYSISHKSYTAPHKMHSVWGKNSFIGGFEEGVEGEAQGCFVCVDVKVKASEVCVCVCLCLLYMFVNFRNINIPDVFQLSLSASIDGTVPETLCFLGWIMKNNGEREPHAERFYLQFRLTDGLQREEGLPRCCWTM